MDSGADGHSCFGTIVTQTPFGGVLVAMSKLLLSLEDSFAIAVRVGESMHFVSSPLNWTAKPSITGCGLNDGDQIPF